LRLVEAGFEVETKSDQSPVTICDRAAEQIILRALAATAPDVPVIAEEEVSAGRIPAHNDTYFLVDPLDGTKEFIRGGDDYTVNIGLIADGQPKLGVVLQPTTGRLWAGIVGDGAFVEANGTRRPIHTRPLGETRAAIASKSHYNQATDDYLTEAVGLCEHVSIGSSLKFCIVAEGKADIYQFLGGSDAHDPNHAGLLWDTAISGADELAERALSILVRAFGAAAGDIALAHGAMGVALTGGLANRIAHLLQAPAFEARFTAKGRYRERMQHTPVRLLIYAEPGLLGAAIAFEREFGA
jgi:3'(2'), 5'-bisphosphate nucleotidase